MDLNVLKRFKSVPLRRRITKRSTNGEGKNLLTRLFCSRWRKSGRKREANYATKIHLNASYQKMIEKMMSRSESKIKEQETYNTTQKNDIHKPKSSLFLKITASIAIVLSVGLGTLYYMECYTTGWI